MKYAWAGLASILSLWSGFASAQEALTLEEAVARVQGSPAAVAARARIEEARGRKVGASALLHDNPVLRGARGPRESDSGDYTDSEIELSQMFELGGRRGARVAGAEAEVAAAEAEAANLARDLTRATANAFLRALHAQERARLAEEMVAIATQTLDVAQRRFKAGDVAVLDVNISLVALARARTEVLTSQAGSESALRDLRILLGMEQEKPLKTAGDLRQRPDFVLEELLKRAAGRPDIRSLEARLRQAEADLQLAQALAWPDFGLGVRKAREEGDDILQGTVSFTLPVFQRGQGLRLEAAAVQQRLQLELNALRTAVDVEVKSAALVAELWDRAAAQLEAEAVPLSVENESLARRSYEAGQIGLTDLLALRRETVDTRLRHLDVLLDAALARFNLRVAAGELP